MVAFPGGGEGVDVVRFTILVCSSLLHFFIYGFAMVVEDWWLHD